MIKVSVEKLLKYTMKNNIKTKHDETKRNTKANTKSKVEARTNFCKHMIGNHQALHQLDEKDQMSYEPN